MTGTVLIVDDDPVIQRLLQVNLEMEGYEVDLASDGDEALVRARAGHPDLVLLDIMMPKRDGWTVCRELKSDPATARIPVVLLSARAMQADIDRGLAMADAYVTKPFDPIELLEVIARLLAR